MPIILPPSSMPIDRAVDSDEAYKALLHLLDEKGIYSGGDNLAVNKVVTPSGFTFYVVIASNNIGRAVKDAITSVTTHKPEYRTFALSLTEARELVDQGSRRFF